MIHRVDQCFAGNNRDWNTAMSMDKSPFVSVIIPVYNDSDRLKLCLEALEKQDYPGNRFEIIVIDNASKEPVKPVTDQFERVILLHESQPGPDVARNTGLASAKGEILAFTDSDCIPYPDWLTRGVNKLLENPDAGLVGGRVDVFPQDENHLTWAEYYELAFAFPTKDNINSHHFMPTCNMFTTRKVFDQVGLFDPDLKTPGDEEWGQRVYSHNLPLIYDETVAIRHPARRSLKAISKKTKRITYRFVGLLRERSTGSIYTNPRFLRRLFILPVPYEWKRISRSKLSFTNKLKVVVVVTWVRTIRAYEMVKASFMPQERLW